MLKLNKNCKLAAQKINYEEYNNLFTIIYEYNILYPRDI